MSLTGKYLQSKIYIVPWQRIEVISGPVTSMPSSLSNVMPDDSTMNGNATAGDIGDFAILMNLWPMENKIYIVISFNIMQW